MSQSTIEKFDHAVMHTYGRYQMVAEQGSGVVCTDEDGKKYYDLGSGIGTNSLGYCNEAWVEAVCNQVKSLQHTSNYYYTKVQADFASLLCESTGYQKVFFGNSGAEANECAIKIARKYSFDKYGAERNVIITLQNSFHGRTLCTLSATGQDVFHNYFFPFVGGFVHTPANDIEALKQLISEQNGKVCGIMLEYVQGEGGVNQLEQSFVDAIFTIAEQNDILVIADEVQTGVGRTGTLLAGEQFGHHANITTLAKGLAGGLPIGACLADEKCCEVLQKGTHGSTFGGNPVACAGGLAVLKQVLSEGFLDEVKQKGTYIRERLSNLDEVVSISGLGLMIGIALKEKKAGEVGAQAMEEGLLILTAKDKVRLLPPLTISQEDLEKAIDKLEHLLQ